MKQVMYRESITTIRTVEKVTLEDDKVIKREYTEDPQEDLEYHWWDSAYFCIINGDQIDLEETYQQSKTTETPRKGLTS